MCDHVCVRSETKWDSGNTMSCFHPFARQQRNLNAIPGTKLEGPFPSNTRERISPIARMTNLYSMPLARHLPERTSFRPMKTHGFASARRGGEQMGWCLKAQSLHVLKLGIICQYSVNQWEKLSFRHSRWYFAKLFSIPSAEYHKLASAPEWSKVPRAGQAVFHKSLTTKE